MYFLYGTFFCCKKKLLMKKSDFFAGVADLRNDSLPIPEALKDTDRVEYLRDHLLHIAKAIK